MSLESLGYLAYRSEEKGSCFIQILVDVFTEKKGSILELLTEIFLRFPISCLPIAILKSSLGLNTDTRMPISQAMTFLNAENFKACDRLSAGLRILRLPLEKEVCQVHPPGYTMLLLTQNRCQNSLLLMKTRDERGYCALANYTTVCPK
ncbi:hypothetical protein MC885_011317 [Smutsia gigantea]|nr:hypothetical protein MC885_011317 [Smutsia gigantea]